MVRLGCLDGVTFDFRGRYVLKRVVKATFETARSRAKRVLAGLQADGCGGCGG